MARSLHRNTGLYLPSASVVDDRSAIVSAGQSSDDDSDQEQGLHGDRRAIVHFGVNALMTDVSITHGNRSDDSVTEVAAKDSFRAPERRDLSITLAIGIFLGAFGLSVVSSLVLAAIVLASVGMVHTSVVLAAPRRGPRDRPLALRIARPMLTTVLFGPTRTDFAPAEKCACGAAACRDNGSGNASRCFVLCRP